MIRDRGRRELRRYDLIKLAIAVILAIVILLLLLGPLGWRILAVAITETPVDIAEVTAEYPTGITLTEEPTGLLLVTPVEGGVRPSDTATSHPTEIPKSTPTSTATPTVTPTQTVTATASLTQTAASSLTPDSTATVTPTLTATSDPVTLVTPTRSPSSTVAPTPSLTAGVTAMPTSVPVLTATVRPSSTPGPTPVLRQTCGPGRFDQGGYIVGPCQSLSEIASILGVTVRAVLAANPQITDPNLIFPGQVIHIP